MFAEISVDDAKAKLPELLAEVRSGRRFTITRGGEPAADLVPSAAGPRQDYGEAIRDMLNFERIPNVDPGEVAKWIRGRADKVP